MELLTDDRKAFLQRWMYEQIDTHAQEVIFGGRPSQKVWIDVSAGFTAMIPVRNENMEATQLRGKIFAKLDAQFEAGDRFMIGDEFYEVLGVLTQNGMWKEAGFYAYQ